MKYLFICFFIFQFVLLHAQKDFEGMIRYRTKDARETETAEVKIFFTPGKILFHTDNGPEKGEERTLVLLDAARIYEFNMKEKKYRVKKLKAIKRFVAIPERIAGYRATPFSGGMGNSDHLFGSNATLWYADSLLFTVPAKYELNDELLIVKNNHILLKVFINMGDYKSWDEDQTDNNNNAGDSTEMIMNAVTLEAIEIVPGKINPSDFTIPPGFTEWSYSLGLPDTAYSAITDSVVTKVDSAVTIPAIEPAKTKQAKPTQSKTSKTKTATKPAFRKED